LAPKRRARWSLWVSRCWACAASGRNATPATQAPMGSWKSWGCAARRTFARTSAPATAGGTATSTPSSRRSGLSAERKARTPWAPALPRALQGRRGLLRRSGGLRRRGVLRRLGCGSRGLGRAVGGGLSCGLGGLGRAVGGVLRSLGRLARGDLGVAGRVRHRLLGRALIARVLQIGLRRGAIHQENHADDGDDRHQGRDPPACVVRPACDADLLPAERPRLLDRAFHIVPIVCHFRSSKRAALPFGGPNAAVWNEVPWGFQARRSTSADHA